jgi:hypothetical protein
LLEGPLAFLVPDLPNEAGASVEVNAEVRAVPEPTSWAMMLFGLGAVGLALRLKRKPSLAA